MYMLTMGDGMAMGFPDACLTPGTPPVPVPYPNVAESIMAPASVMEVLGDCMPTLNELSSICISEGDEPGTLLGVVSHVISGSTTWLVGSEAVIVGGMPAQRLTSIGGCNSMEALANGPSSCIAPSQFTVLTLG